MFRLRRYRYFVVFAALALLLLYRLTRDTDPWTAFGAGGSFPNKPIDKAPALLGSSGRNDGEKFGSRPTSHSEHATSLAFSTPKLVAAGDGGKTTPAVPQSTAAREDATKEAAAPTITAAPVAIDIPDRLTPHEITAKEQDDKLRPKIPPQYELSLTSISTSTSIQHWVKQSEHFPVATESLLRLPTGTPKKMNKIQHDFGEESVEQREIRETRLAKVKGEMRRAWSGYSQYAWMHDEISPVSKKFRDPFCGWAATLVDALDTLWIMGMREEFDLAVEAVRKIDFTYSAFRTQIPVFETVIRYLGGLLGAFDLTGGHDGGYKILLDKAIELAEILMGTFDTPNRMPVLYYNWQPALASQPKRAGTGVSLAEIGSLLMEFTRLAQLTKEDKYYDAVARITDALVDWQKRGTAVPGIFPERVDATGCNHTASSEAHARRLKEVADLAKAEEEAAESASNHDTEQDYSSEPLPTGEIVTGRLPTDSSASEKPDGTLHRRADPDTSAIRKLALPKLENTLDDETTRDKFKGSLPDMYQKMMAHQKGGQPWLTDSMGPEHCYPQGLTSSSWGTDSFSLGGSQDSTYEYFPKEYLLLGGLEPKYLSLHQNTVEAVRKWLLFRPMVPGDPDVLFSAKLMTTGHPEKDARYDYEVTHLTCFLGGMFAMGGKMFDKPMDVEIGKKLTEGCVWAYSSTPSGIMPEYASVVPCSNVNDCHWNETLWHEYLDPLSFTREMQITDWERRVEEYEQQKIESEHQEAGDKLKGSSTGSDNSTSDSGTLHKRAPPPIPGGGSRPMSPPPRVGSGQQPLVNPANYKPLTHEEYVKKKIETNHLPPGYVTVTGKNYILRPEAIESVWYMYRITGDTTWQDKGWKMFESIIAATQTEVAHSAIDSVLIPNSDKSNSMESFWLAETLKYFYLLYSTPDVISLDDYVLNTEAHPFLRPKP